MLFPALLPRVEQVDHGVLQRIKTFDFVVFVTITCRAGEGQVIQSGVPAF
jgi:hypothetical protein